MLKLFYQPIEDKRKYHDELKKCFFVYKDYIKCIENEILNTQCDIDKCDNPRQRDKLNDKLSYLESFVRCLTVSYPLYKATILMSMERCPEKIEQLSKDYSDRKPLPSCSPVFVTRDDIFEILREFSLTNRKRIIHSLACSYKDSDDLLDALTNGDYNEFSRILKEKCDYSVLSLYFGTVVELVLKHNLIENEINVLYKKMINVDSTNEEQLRTELISDYRNHILPLKDQAFLRVYDRYLTYSKSLNSEFDYKEFALNYIHLIRTLNEQSLTTICWILEDINDLDQIEYQIFNPILKSYEFRQNEELYKWVPQVIREIEDSFIQVGQEITKHCSMPERYSVHPSVHEIDDETDIETVAQERDDESSSPDVLQDVELLHTEPRFKFMYQYNSSFVSAAELQNKMRSGIHYKRGWKNTDIQRNSNNLYYKGAITYRPDIKDFHDEYDEVKWLYEKMVSLTAIENTPENFNSFMFRMTGKRKDNQEIVRIPWLLTANELYFWIGHIINRPSVSKARYPDGTHQLSKEAFFETVKDESEFDKSAASKVNSSDSTWRGGLIPKQISEDINKFIPEMLSTRKKTE